MKLKLELKNRNRTNFFFSINIIVQHNKLHKSQSRGTKVLKCLGINKNKENIGENKDRK